MFNRTPCQLLWETSTNAAISVRILFQPPPLIMDYGKVLRELQQVDIGQFY